MTYFKSSGQIEELLTVMGAPRSALELKNTRVSLLRYLKDVFLLPLAGQTVKPHPKRPVQKPRQ